MENGEPRVIAVGENGSALLPSVVAIAPDGAVTVGERAIEMEPHLTVERDGRVSAVGFAGGEYGAVIRSVKRYMGLGGDEIAPEDRARYTFADLSGPVVRFQIGKRVFTPSQISAEILRALKRRRRTRARQQRKRKSRARRHHRSRLLQRRPAPGHQGCRPPRRSRSRAPGERTDRRVARLRPQQDGDRQRRGVRLRRRHFRHFDSQHQGRNLRGARDQRRYASRRRRYRPRACRLAARRTARHAQTRSPRLEQRAHGRRGRQETPHRRRPRPKSSSNSPAIRFAST